MFCSGWAGLGFLLRLPDYLHARLPDCLPGRADRLLNAGAAAVAAAPLGQQRRQLHEEYTAVRRKLLDHLLQQAAAMCQQGMRGWAQNVPAGGGSARARPSRMGPSPQSGHTCGKGLLTC